MYLIFQFFFLRDQQLSRLRPHFQTVPTVATRTEWLPRANTVSCNPHSFSALLTQKVAYGHHPASCSRARGAAGQGRGEGLRGEDGGWGLGTRRASGRGAERGWTGLGSRESAGVDDTGQEGAEDCGAVTWGVGVLGRLLWAEGGKASHRPAGCHSQPDALAGPQDAQGGAGARGTPGGRWGPASACPPSCPATLAAPPGAPPPRPVQPRVRLSLACGLGAPAPGGPGLGERAAGSRPAPAAQPAL